jgi:predicted membrane protein
MPFIAEFFDYIKKHNIIFGIFITDVIVFISYLVSFGARFYFMGDIQFLVGNLIGVYFALRFRKPHQSPLKYGLLVGIIGSLISIITLTLFQWSYALKISIEILIAFLIPGIIIGTLMGFIIGYIFKLRSKKKEPLASDDFFDKLKE